MDNSSKEVYKELLKKKVDLEKEIGVIEESYEGVQNEHNMKLLGELNHEKQLLLNKKKNHADALQTLELQLEGVNKRLEAFTGSGSEKIIQAIAKQSFFFFINKLNVVFEKTSGLFWPNMNKIDHKCCEKIGAPFTDIEGLSGWRFPDAREIFSFATNKKNPFRKGGCNYLMNCRYFWTANGSYSFADLCDNTSGSSYSDRAFLPCTSALTDNSRYAVLTSGNDNILSPEQRAKLILELFLEKNLVPAFDDKAITPIFEKIYLEKPPLLKQLQEVEAKIAELQNKVELTLDFDYLPLMEKYDLPAIEKSVIKYYEAVQSWCDEMLDKLNDYEKSHADLIADFNQIGGMLANKYIANDKLSETENDLLAARQAFFRKKLALSMGGVKRKIVAVKQQADALEDRLEDVDEGNDALHQLAAIEKEPLVSFPFLAENTAKIIRNALRTTEYFRTHREFIKFAITAWDSWSKDYLHFKTAGFAQIQSSCQEDSIEDEVWQVWCQDWSDLRYKVEQKLQPLIERGLKGDIPTIQGDKNVIEELVKVLAAYKAAIDNFFLEDRKAVYQNFFFQAGGELQEKFESELKLYRCTVKLQSDLQKLIFNCSEVEDRMFILTWASDLLNIQIDELLTYVADQRFTKISEKVLSDFAQLRLQNLDVYLNDAKVYGQEKERREKEFNSLMFKMRKEAMK